MEAARPVPRAGREQVDDDGSAGILLKMKAAAAQLNLALYSALAR